jgi:tetratricopeptide (TPR) repeat protein
MNRMSIGLLLALSGWTTIVHGQSNSAPAPQAGASSTVSISKALVDEAVTQQKLDAAITLIKQRENAQAVVTLDQIIHLYEAAYQNNQQRIYCANTPAESLLYLTEGAKANVPSIVLKPIWSMAYFLKAYALQEMHLMTEAKASLSAAIKLSPHNPHYLSELGSMYQVLHDWPNAFDAFTQAEQDTSLAVEQSRVSERCRALRGQGYVLVEQKKLDEAEQKYRQCLSINPGDEKSPPELAYIAQLRAKEQRH